MTFSDFINFFVTLLVITNPFLALSACLRIMHGHSADSRKRIAWIGTTSICIIFLTTTWIGVPILQILGIKLPAFQVAGSLVLLVLAFSMLNASESPIKQSPTELEEKKFTDIGAIVPLAMPIVAGPGAMVAIIIGSHEYPGLSNQILLALAAMLVTAIISVIFFSASKLEKLIGPQGINIFNRISGLLLAAISIQSLAAGALGLFPGWGG